MTYHHFTFRIASFIPYDDMEKLVYERIINREDVPGSRDVLLSRTGRVYEFDCNWMAKTQDEAIATARKLVESLGITITEVVY